MKDNEERGKRATPYIRVVYKKVVVLKTMMVSLIVLVVDAAL
jgi:hypothetical protein